MTTLEKWHKAVENLDRQLMNESLHDDFVFMNYSQGKEISKSEIIEWMLSGDIKREKVRILYENDEVGVEHSLVSFNDGNRQAVLGFFKKKNNQLFSAETGATSLTS